MAAKKARNFRKASRSDSKGYKKRHQSPPEMRVYDQELSRIHQDLDAAYEQKMKAVNIEARMKI